MEEKKTDQVYSLSFNNEFQIVENNQRKSNPGEISQTSTKFYPQYNGMYSLTFNRQQQSEYLGPNPAEYGSGDYVIVPQTTFEKKYFNGIPFVPQPVGAYQFY